MVSTNSRCKFALMRPTTVLILIMSVLVLNSCTSEYEECLQEGKYLKERLSDLERNDLMFSNDYSNAEAKEIYDEISLLSKVSGNEDLFMKEVFGN